MAQELIEALNEALENCISLRDQGAILGAIQEIERLRASQFRWIPVEGSRVQDETVLVRWAANDVRTLHMSSVVCYPQITHWAPIPPLPEKSREDRDHELVTQYLVNNCYVSAPNEAGAAFLAGLKAAREQKP